MIFYFCFVLAPCDSNPCNDGTCSVNNGGAYQCTCKPGWIGRNCNQRKIMFLRSILT